MKRLDLFRDRPKDRSGDIALAIQDHPGEIALDRLRELRNSLVPVNYDPITAYNPGAIRLPTLPPLDDRCWDKRGNFRDRCATPTATAAR